MSAPLPQPSPLGKERKALLKITGLTGRGVKNKSAHVIDGETEAGEGSRDWVKAAQASQRHHDRQPRLQTPSPLLPDFWPQGHPSHTQKKAAAPGSAWVEGGRDSGSSSEAPCVSSYIHRELALDSWVPSSASPHRLLLHSLRGPISQALPQAIPHQHI